MPRTQAPQKEHTRDRKSGTGSSDGRRAQDDGSTQGEAKGGSTGPVKSSHIIEEHIDVGVPRDTAYDQWTRYEDLSHFTKKESAKPKRRDRIGFTSKIGPSSRTWETQIVEQVPGRRIVWRSIGGAKTMGVVSFHEIDERLTRVMIQMEYHPTGVLETVGNFLRMQRRRVRKDLRLFKNFIELRGEATGEGARQAVNSGHGLRQETDERLGDFEGSDNADDEEGDNGAGQNGSGRGGGRHRATNAGKSAARKTAGAAKTAARKSTGQKARKARAS